MRLWTLVVVFGLLAGESGAGDWPGWRGPNRDGVSEETGLLSTWPENGPDLVWRVDVAGKGYSTPSVVGDRVYLMGSEGRDREFVQALDARDGSVVWSTHVGNVGLPDQDPSYPGSRSTPIVDGERLYVFSSDGDVACLERASGKVVWTRNVREEFGGKPGRWAYSESPLVDGDRVVVTPGGQAAVMVALDKRTGETVWTTSIAEAEDAAFSSIAISNASGKKQYVQFLKGGLLGVDAETGEVLWRYHRTAEGSPANIPTPLIQGDTVYNATHRAGGALLKIDLDGDPVVTEMYFGSKLPVNLGGSILTQGHLFGTTRSALVCTEFETGELKWTDRSVGPASVFYAEGHVYLASEDGEVALVAATPTAYVEKGRFTLPNPPVRGDSKIWAYPVVANGRLYIRDVNVVWCYDVSQSDGEGGE